MSAEDAALVRSLQPPPEADLARDVFMRDGDPEVIASAEAALAQFLTDDFECVFHRASDAPRTGVEGLREAWLDWMEPWETYRAEIDEVIDLGERVLVISRDYARRSGMADEVELQGSALYTMRDGKIARAEYFAQREDAFAAAGLS